MAGVFLSHASVDKPLVDELKTMLQTALGLAPGDIFYSSGRGTGVPTGDSFREYIRDRMEEADFVVAVITPSYRHSEFCLAELGAVWYARDKDFFPVCVPAVDRADLKATLTGIHVERIDDSAVLAELLQRVAKSGNLEYNAPACDEAVRSFLSTLPARLKGLEMPNTVPVQELEEAETTIESLGNELAAARDEIRAAQTRFEELRAAKTAEEIEELSMPEDDRERIEQLLADAKEAVRAVRGPVGDVLPYELRGEGMPWPDSGSYELEDVRRVVDDGLLYDGEDGYVYLNTEWPKVRRAVDAVQAVQEQLRGLDADGEEWFTNTYDAPPDLRQGAAFRELLAPRRF
jgi:hypothetical protein